MVALVLMTVLAMPALAASGADEAAAPTFIERLFDTIIGIFTSLIDALFFIITSLAQALFDVLMAIVDSVKCLFDTLVNIIRSIINLF
jgi:phage-related protein